MVTNRAKHHIFPIRNFEKFEYYVQKNQEVFKQSPHIISDYLHPLCNNVHIITDT